MVVFASLPATEPIQKGLHTISHAFCVENMCFPWTTNMTHMLTADKPRETFAGREAGGMRNTGSTAGPSASPWDDVSSPNEDPYKLLTPPISPAQVRIQLIRQNSRH